MAIAYFSSNGYVVSIPLNDIQDYDLVIEKEDTINLGEKMNKFIVEF